MIFGVLQTAGCLLLAGTSANIWPFFAGLFLLLPGSLIFLLLHAEFPIFAGIIILINTCVWYGWNEMWRHVRRDVAE